jgi:hypothetical protein
LWRSSVLIKGQLLTVFVVVGPAFTGTVGAIVGVDVTVETIVDVRAGAGVAFVQAARPETPTARTKTTQNLRAAAERVTAELSAMIKA